jgi:hypothetical protein
MLLEYALKSRSNLLFQARYSKVSGLSGFRIQAVVEYHINLHYNKPKQHPTKELVFSMGTEGSTTIIRGFKVSVMTLDAFLAAHGVDETYGTPPFYCDHPENDPISTLLFSKISQHDPNADKNRFRVLIPLYESKPRFKTAYVAYAWVPVRTHREIKMDEALPAEIPKGFEELRQEILSYEGLGKDEFGNPATDEDKISDEGKMGVYAIITYNIRGGYRRDQWERYGSEGL